MYDIEQAQIEYEGNTYKTTPVTINVTEAVAIPRDPNDPKNIVDEKLHLVAEVSKRNPMSMSRLRLCTNCILPRM